MADYTAPITINIGKAHTYGVQKTIGGWVVVYFNEDGSIRNVDGGKTHAKRQNAYAKAKRLNDKQGYVTLLSEQAPRANDSASTRWGSSTAGTEMKVWLDAPERWFGVLRGINKDGNGFESEDIGPYASRVEAETAIRDYYEEDQKPVENIYPEEVF